MKLPELIVLDVGHGNCALLQDTLATTMFDCPPTPTVLHVLEALDIKIIDHVLISHADLDHSGGLSNLLTHVTVRHIYINPDANKKSQAWIDTRFALMLAEQKGTIIHTSLTTNRSGKIISGQVEIEILAPSPGVALGGAGGYDLEGRRLTSNAMSVVIGLVHDNHRIALLPGDMDDVGLDNLLKKQRDIKAQILVFPHHGGNPGAGNGQQFAQKLCEAVQPRLVLFSHGRNHFLNPRRDIIRGITLFAPQTHIMCTQLSRHCSVELPFSDFTHLAKLPAEGYASNNCCGGTISVKIDGEHTTYTPLPASHRAFIDDTISTPMCLQSLALANT